MVFKGKDEFEEEVVVDKIDKFWLRIFLVYLKLWESILVRLVKY